jgi:glycosyltransferase involved in cell wall biosynthesis
MKIGIVATFYRSVGGIGSYVRNVVEGMQKIGIPPLVLSPDANLSDQESDYISTRSKWRSLTVILTVYHLKKNDVRVVQCHGTWYLLLACLIHKFTSKLKNTHVRVIAVKHSDIVATSAFKHRVMQFLDNRSDGIVFVCRYLQDKYENLMGFRFNKPTYVVNPGCSQGKFFQRNVDDLADALDSASRYPILTYIGLFEYPGKVQGLILLFEALVILKKLYPGVLLAVAGRGTLKSKVVAAVDRLGLQDRVKLIESIDNPYDLLQLSDLHCHISLQDSFPMVVLEALSTGTPVVASATGELPNVKIEGLVITENKPAAIADAIARTIENPPLVDEAKLRESFDWARKVSDLIEIMQVGNV